ncbi:MAG: ketopantoate reductase family protein [Candidatus Gastranaerophilales bacterium]|nr:ketopantoate reductase family protein [Candidatus Gastranaerophilales bacterium]
MDKIRNVLICGLGGVGCIYAHKLLQNKNINLKILVDNERYNRYRQTPRLINGIKYEFEYILPNNKDFKPDLIIITIKNSGLKETIHNIENFVSDNTIILSFINGVTSETELAKVYGEDKLLYSYVICHTIFRKCSNIEHDGVTKVVFGSRQANDHKVDIVKKLFDESGLNYEIPSDMYKSLWLKFSLNCCVNQLSAITGKTFKELWESPKCLDVMNGICQEIQKIAKKEGITDTSDFWDITLSNLHSMLPEGKTSMLQDMEAKIKPETELFGGTVIKLGQKHNIDTPINKMMYDLISILSEDF